MRECLKKLFVNCRLCDSNKVIKWLSSDDFTILLCRDCQNGFTVPLPSAIDYSKKDFHANEVLDEEISEKTLNDLPLEWKEGIKLQVSAICKHLQPGARILEIGCGEGILLNELKNLGFEVTGIEPSVTASKRAQEKGLKVFQGYFPHSAMEGKTYDMIIMSHVLEHLEDPHQILINITKSLTSDGLLLLVQTNFKGLMPRLQSTKWYAWVPEQHFWHFTPDGIINICRRHKMSFVDKKYYPLVHINSRLNSAMNALKIGDLLPFVYDQFHIILRRS